MILLIRNMNYRDDSFTTHQPRTVYDSGNGTMNHFWDANGNLAQIVDCKHNAARLHEWDEENRLRFVLGEKYAGYYGYDANGERVYKLTGSSSMDDVNAGSIKAQAIFDDAVLYPNPYIVVTPKGYTKHYYAGTERLATVIGGGGFLDLQTPIVPLTSQHDIDIVKSFYEYYKDKDPFNYQQIISKSEPTEDIFGNAKPDLEYQCQPVELVLVDVYTSQDILLGSISTNQQVFTEEDEVYFYHGDHLGSANWITDADGKPVQYIHYAPYGEQIANQTPYGYDERFKFTGKERDWETGYDYFGARFYDYRKGFWNSVDPLADKNISNSPYMYCSGNPIMLVDPDGRDGQKVKENISQYFQFNVEYSVGLQFGFSVGSGKKQIGAGLNLFSVQIDREHDINNVSLTQGCYLGGGLVSIAAKNVISPYEERKMATKEETLSVSYGLVSVDFKNISTYAISQNRNQKLKEKEDIDISITHKSLDANIEAIVGIKISITMHIKQFVKDLFE